MSSSLLEQELAHLHKQIGEVSRQGNALKDRLRLLEADLAKTSAEMQRLDAVRSLCDALDLVAERKAGELFWEGTDGPRQAAGLVKKARERIGRFETERQGLLEQQASVREELDRCAAELLYLDDEVQNAYDREARRGQEFVVEREIFPLPDRKAVMPWSRETESEKRFRKALLSALLAAFILGVLTTLLKVPAPVRPIVAEVPKRLVSMLRREPPKPERPREEKKPEKEQEGKAPKEDRPEPIPREVQAARKKAESSGILAFKKSFQDMMDEAPAAKIGAQSRLSSQPAPGEARTGRSLVALPPGGGAASSGGIGNSGINRTLDQGNSKQIASVDFTRVESKVAAQTEEARPVSASSGSGTARTDEEIQIVFDKYKAALYRLYNAELRRNPTLRGRIILRITIEPGGEVSACSVQSNDLRSPELVDQILARVRKFQFGPKEHAARTTILYPIDFLPGA